MFHHLGTSKGGDSIWGGKFEDEFHETLKVSAYKCSYMCTGVHIASVHLVEMSIHICETVLCHVLFTVCDPGSLLCEGSSVWPVYHVRGHLYSVLLVRHLYSVLIV